MQYQKKLYQYIFIGCLFVVSIVVKAKELQWVDREFRYYANNDKLTDVIQNFATNYGLSSVVSDLVDEQLSGRFAPDTPEEFLNYLSDIYNLVWYYDGAILYVYKRSEVQSQLIQLVNSSVDDLQNTLKKIDIWDPRFQWQPIAGQSSVYVSGPPRYIELVSQISFLLEQHSEQSINKIDDFYIEIIPLKYATAIDRTINYRNQEVVVPGVATVLNKILLGYNVTVVSETQGADNNEKDENVEIDSVRSGAVVQAEPSLNAVIVRDLKSRLPIYHRLIKQLDKPQNQIEIALSIVDVSVNDLEQIGIEWAGGIDLGGNTIVDIQSTGAVGSGGTVLSNGLDFSSVIDQSNLNFLFARVNLMQNEGSAQVVSKPILLTQENIEAVLSTSSTYHVQLIGTDSQSLAEVTSGMVFKVLPRVIDKKDQKESHIFLDIQIEDGSTLQDNLVNGLPTTTKTEMSTRAMVKQGESLLIGGVYRDEMSSSSKEVPFLSKIPLLGALFKSDVSLSNRTVRLFIIEPKIVDTMLGEHLDLDNLTQSIYNIDEFSNNSYQLKKALTFYSCLPTEEAKLRQSEFASSDIASRRESCVLSDGRSGEKVITGECDVERDSTCIEANEWDYDYDIKR